MLGFAAKMYVNDEEKVDQFLIECSKQCHHQSAKDFWGEQLVFDIIKYTREVTKKQNELIII